MQTPTHSRSVLAALLAGGCALASASHGAITGQWDFLSGDLSARVGRPLEYLDGPGGPTATQTIFGTTTALGIPDIGGQPAHVMGFPSSLPTMGYVVYPNAHLNGGGLLVNRYTLIFDLLFPVASSSNWRALVQIDDPTNANDADLFINASGAIGISGQYQGVVQANTWHRIAFAVDLAAPEGPQLRKYLDGVLVGQQTLAGGIDGRWALNPVGGAVGESALLFTDNNADGGHVQPGFVSSIQIHNEALSSAYLAALGAPMSDQIPSTIAVPASIVRQRPAPDAVNVLPGASVEVVLGSGSSPVPPASVALLLNGQPLPSSVIDTDGVLNVRATLPDLAARSENALRLSFTDPGTGTVTADWSFRMAPFDADPALAESLGAGLIAHWPLDDGTNNPGVATATDVVSANVGSVTAFDPAEAWLGTDRARFGGALHVDGESTYATIPSSETLDLQSNQVSLSLWVNLAQLPADLPDSFGGLYDSTGDAYVLYLDRGANELRFKVTDASGQAARPGIPADRLVTGEWLHVAAVYDGRASATAGEARLYLNGELVDLHLGNDGAGGTGLTGAVRTGQIAGIGRNGDEARHYLNAAVDDIGIWKRALTVDEIGYLAAGKVVPPPAAVADPLTIVTQPQGASVLAGSPITFRVVVEGGVAPITYQWRRDGEVLPEATGSQWVVLAGPGTAGTYTVTVRDASTSIESTPAILKVVPVADQPAESLAQGLAALWPLDDGTANPLATNVVDVARGNPARLTAPVTQDAWLGTAAGRFGGALRFNGQDSYVSIPPSEVLDVGSDQVTLAAWVRLTSLPSELPDGFGGVYDSVQDDYVLYLDRGNRELRFKVTVSSGQAARPGIPEELLARDQWIHVAGVYDGRATDGAGEARLYLNGELIDSHLGNDGSGGTGLTGFVRPGQAAAIGRNGTEARYFLEASVDDIGVWSRALSGAEITYLATGHAIPAPAPGEPLRVTQITASGGTVTLTWSGGRAPYQLQRRAQLAEGGWLDVGAPTDTRTATVPITGETAFFQVVTAGSAAAP